MGKGKKRRSLTSISLDDVDTAALAKEMSVSLVDALSGNASLWSEDPDLSSVKMWVPTQFPWFDWMLSNGRGLPVGRIIQLWGLFFSCKTSFAQSLIRPWQDANGYCMYFDFEDSCEPDWLRSYNVIPELFTYPDIDTIDQAFDDINAAFANIDEKRKDFASKKKVWEPSPLLILWDSVAQALPTEERDEEKFGKKSVGVVARAFSKACRKLPRNCSKHDASVIFVNQTRTKIDADRWSDPNVRPGGKALDFASAAIIKMWATKLKKEYKKRKITWGMKVVMTAHKNRLTAPDRTCEIIVDFKNGANPVLSTHHLLKQTGFIVAAGKKGQRLKGRNQDTFKGDEWPDFMRKNGKLVKKAVKEALASLSPPES